jgi:hypothetical protein
MTPAAPTASARPPGASWNVTATDVSQQPGPTRSEPLPRLVTELWELSVAYLRQETVGPLGGLGRFLGFGAVGALLAAVGTSVLLVAVLRVLQTETGTTFRGNLTPLPYVITAGAGLLVAVVAGLSVVSGSSRRSTRGKSGGRRP